MCRFWRGCIRHNKDLLINLGGFVHEACLTGGFGAELAARIQDELFDYLDAPIKRVAAGDFPIPFSPPLEDFVLPKVSDVIEATREVTYR
ncbi:MAG: transketolase C-terminal domain-containing protein [Desulfobacteraceae bacterium]|nr:transketolase C-terminal domain-containing protein [Desulfobacteraceae bacterium]